MEETRLDKVRDKVLGGSFGRLDEAPDEAPDEVFGRRKGKFGTKFEMRFGMKFQVRGFHRHRKRRNPAFSAASPRKPVR